MAVAPNPGNPNPNLGNPNPGDDDGFSVAAIFCAMVGGVSPLLLTTFQRWNGEAARLATTQFFDAFLAASTGAKVAQIAVSLAPWLSSAAIAAFLTFVWSERNKYRAYCFGIGAPALFVSLVAGANNTGSSSTTVPINANQANATSSLLQIIVPIAYAGSDQPANPNAENVLRFDFSKLSGQCGLNCVIRYVDKDGSLLAVQILDPNSPLKETTVPDSAATAVISGIDGTNSGSIDVKTALDVLNGVTTNDSGDKAAIVVSKERNYFNDLKSTLGATNVLPYDMKLSVEPNI